MSQNEAAQSAGVNARPLHDTLAQTGPGIPDEAVGPDEEGPAERFEDSREDTAGGDKLDKDLGPHSDVPEGP
jgi:hypothetical protein